jgi:hypothetical protein
MIKNNNMGNNLSEEIVHEQMPNAENDINIYVERYLKSVYERECVLNINKREIKFIRRGIESLVKEIIGSVLHDDFVVDKINELKRQVKNRGGKFSYCSKDIIGVGSIYEQTKNCFPNEFDFVFLLGCVQGISRTSSNTDFGAIGHYFRQTVDSVANHLTNKGTNDFSHIEDDTGRQLYFISKHPSRGPSIGLKFQYVSWKSRTIKVDLVAAIKILPKSFIQDVSAVCDLKPFCNEIIKTGSYLLVYPRRITFTESELFFMKNSLSCKHRMVYQILKFIINGHDENENVQHYLFSQRKKHYSSYMIKTMMIYHHYECSYLSTSNIGPCVIQILQRLSEYHTTEDFPKLSEKISKLSYKLCLKKSLRPLIVCLQRAAKHEEFSKTERELEDRIPVLKRLQRTVPVIDLSASHFRR